MLHPRPAHRAPYPAKTLALTSRDGKGRIVFTFPGPTPVMIQDDRQWGPAFSVRIGCLEARTFKAGETFAVRFTVATREPQALTLDEPVTLQAGTEWLPLKMEADIRPGSALDFTALGLTERPAGKYGRVVARGPHFEFENKPGVAQRSRKTLLAWGALPHIARRGRAEIRLALSPAKDYKVYTLSTGGARTGGVPARVAEGRLAFTADVGARPESATLLYEVARD